MHPLGITLEGLKELLDIRLQYACQFLRRLKRRGCVPALHIADELRRYPNFFSQILQKIQLYGNEIGRKIALSK